MLPAGQNILSTGDLILLLSYEKVPEDLYQTYIRKTDYNAEKGSISSLIIVRRTGKI